MKQLRQIVIISLTILMIGLLWPLISRAGGWALVTLDELPQQVSVEQPLVIGFMVRQHGWTPVSDYKPQVTAFHTETGQTVTATAQSAGRQGHYEATLTLPQPGQWSWSIDLGYGLKQGMPPLKVEKDRFETQPVAWPFSVPLSVGFVGLAGVVGAAVVWWRRPTRWLLGLAGLTLAISGAGFALALLTAPQVEAKKPFQGLEQTDVGAALFVAKGCTVCHQHEAIERTSDFSTDIGPNLTNLSLTPVYLQVWLKNPAEVKRDTKMPNLDLGEAEIEALISFLTMK